MISEEVGLDLPRVVELADLFDLVRDLAYLLFRAQGPLFFVGASSEEVVCVSEAAAAADARE